MDRADVMLVADNQVFYYARHGTSCMATSMSYVHVATAVSRWQALDATEYFHTQTAQNVADVATHLFELTCFIPTGDLMIVC